MSRHRAYVIFKEQKFTEFTDEAKLQNLFAEFTDEVYFKNFQKTIQYKKALKILKNPIKFSFELLPLKKFFYWFQNLYTYIYDLSRVCVWQYLKNIYVISFVTTRE
jgi:hypothetical protein